MTEIIKSDNTLTSDICASILNNVTVISTALTREDCCELPSWWISKLSAASAYLETLKDHLSEEAEEQVEEAIESDDTLIDIADEMLPPSARMMKRLQK